MQIAYSNYIKTLNKRSKLNIVERKIIEKYKRINDLNLILSRLDNFRDKLIIKKELLKQNIELCEIIEKYTNNII